MTIQIKDEYKVKDLYEAAYLYTLKTSLFRLEKQKGYFYFVFSDKATCEEHKKKFWSYNTKVDAKRYADALRSLKDMIFSEGR